MKRIISITLAVLMIFSVIGITATAASTDKVKTSGDYEYKVLNDGTVEIVKYTGEATDITVPSKIAGKTVSTIGGSAFNYIYCKITGTVTIPGCIKTIVGGAFYGSEVKKVIMKNGVETIGRMTFSSCRDLESVTIPNSVKEIGSNAFSACWSLKSIVIPDSVKKIGEAAFYDCKLLENIKIGKNVESIGPAAFNGTKYAKIASNWSGGSLWRGVMYIGKYLIKADNSLKSVKIKKGTKLIADHAFMSTSDLTEITIPSSVKFIGKSAFYHCYKLKKVTIEKGVKRIETYAFYECPLLKSVTIPDSVETIGKYAFGYHDGIDSKGMPNAGLPPEIYKNFKISGGVGTAAEKYTKKNSIKFIAIAPSAPSKFTATQSTSAVKLTWSKVTGAAGYRIYKYDKNAGRYVKVADTLKTTYTIKNLKAGTKYQFAVKAYAKSGNTKLWSAKKVLTTATKIAA